MNFEELFRKAETSIKPHKVGDRLFGNVAATILTESGNFYSGVCIDTGSGTGFCAEAAAVGAMVTAGEYKIKKVVAVWKDLDGVAYVVPSCGRCREFMRQIDESNLEAEVILGKVASMKLKELLPQHEWPSSL